MGSGGHPPFGSAQDTHGDGLVDAVLHFDASALVDGGAIDAGTTQLLITGQTTGGAPAHGIDDVRIVGGGG